MEIDFKLLCEEILLESVLDPILARISADAVNAKRDYDNLVKQAKQNPSFLFNALKHEINNLRKELKTELSKFNVDLSTTQKFDDWIIDRTGKYPGLKNILYSYIKESKFVL